MPSVIENPLTKEIASQAIATLVPRFNLDVIKPLVFEAGDGLQYAICGGDQWVSDGSQHGHKKRRVFFLTADLRAYVTDVQEVVKNVTP